MRAQYPRRGRERSADFETPKAQEDGGEGKERETTSLASWSKSNREKLWLRAAGRHTGRAGEYGRG